MMPLTYNMPDRRHLTVILRGKPTANNQPVRHAGSRGGADFGRAGSARLRGAAIGDRGKIAQRKRRDQLFPRQPLDSGLCIGTVLF